ncbi:unnamed protein product [Protopolystoma xenopodis]|uniref:Uncharacterized protein n=1 Tax=Protopolystoma xenopodis TaxID=117903 RepID=A0A3S5AVR7_9PLAT|nr:unnamed protein product [Protopolystoma xenopodis]
MSRLDFAGTKKLYEEAIANLQPITEEKTITTIENVSLAANKYSIDEQNSLQVHASPQQSDCRSFGEEAHFRLARFLDRARSHVNPGKQQELVHLACNVLRSEAF